MYRSDLDARHKGSAVAAVAAIHAALLLALLQMSGTVDLTNTQDALKMFEVEDVVPPPPIEPPPPAPTREAREQPKEEEGAASAENIRSKASPIPDPKPVIKLPPPPAPAVSPTPREGTAPTQGAAPVRGPGTGAGGTGTGTGSGSGGIGSGGGGAGGVVTRHRMISRPLSGRDFPREFRPILAQGRSPFVKFTILPSGRTTNCTIYQSSGVPALDNTLCALVTSRFLFRPAMNRRGEAVTSEAFYRQEL